MEGLETDQIYNYNRLKDFHDKMEKFFIENEMRVDEVVKINVASLIRACAQSDDEVASLEEVQSLLEMSRQSLILINMVKKHEKIGDANNGIP